MVEGACPVCVHVYPLSVSRCVQLNDRRRVEKGRGGWGGLGEKGVKGEKSSNELDGASL